MLRMLLLLLGTMATDIRYRGLYARRVARQRRH